MKLILASSSPARLSVLRQAGIEPVVFTPEVNEEREVQLLEEELGRKLEASELVLHLARLKAENVAARFGSENPGLVLGGDSAFLLDGEIFGKPHEPEIAFARAKAHRGKTGILFSGHWLIDTSNAATPRAEGAVATASVKLSADITDEELTDYVATGEPLELAGGFAIDGRAGAFIESIEGAPSAVIGLSLPTLRELVIKLQHSYTGLW